VRPDGDGIEEMVGDKGYHSNQSLMRGAPRQASWRSLSFDG